MMTNLPTVKVLIDLHRAKGLIIDGTEIRGVRNVRVSRNYSYDDIGPREVTIDLLAAEVIEVEPDDR
jgi:tmRNA-binding protein